MMTTETRPATPDGYIAHLPQDRKHALSKLRDVILANIPSGYQESITYGMISYVIPHSIYPPRYHCDPKLPLSLLSIASQKNFIALYHMGIYASPALLDWFVSEYPNHCRSKLDMGKSCIRFKKMDDIPFVLIGLLAGKMTTDDWINCYESALKMR